LPHFNVFIEPLTQIDQLQRLFPPRPLALQKGTSGTSSNRTMSRFMMLKSRGCQLHMRTILRLRPAFHIHQEALHKKKVQHVHVIDSGGIRLPKRFVVSSKN
jgi:hypothetical protein